MNKKLSENPTYSIVKIGSHHNYAIYKNNFLIGYSDIYGLIEFDKNKRRYAFPEKILDKSQANG